MDAASRSTHKSVGETVDPSAPLVVEERFTQGVHQRLREEGYRFGFFQAVRLLMLLFPDAPAPGTTSDYAASPIHFRPNTDLVFPATDVKRVASESPERVQVVLNFMGLYGVDAPLPYYFYEDLARLGEDARPHRDFLDVFNHRLYAFFYQAWTKYRPGLHHRSDGSDRHSKRLIALTGLGTPYASEEVPFSLIRLASQAGLMGARARNASGLRSLIKAVFEGVAVTVVENMPRWVTIPARKELGEESFQLGQGATIGEQVFDRSGKFRVQLGPLGVKQYLSLLPGGKQARELEALVRLYSPDYLDFDIELKVNAEDMSKTELGASSAKLGLTTSLGQPTEPQLSRVVDYQSRSSRYPVRA